MLAEQVFLGKKDLFCFHENAPGGLKHIEEVKRAESIVSESRVI